MYTRIALSIVIFLSLVTSALPGQVFACGCGMAMTEEAMFQSLREPEAYLVVKPVDQKSYDVMTYFRLYSENPNVGTIPIVFPLDAIPSAVDGKKTNSYDFQKYSGIQDAKNAHENYASGIQNIQRSGQSALQWTAFGAAGAIAEHVMTTRVGALPPGAGVSEGGINALAHFEFDGGTFDLYDQKSLPTLKQFAESLNIPLADSVKALVEKYKDSYIAVLRLEVPNSPEKAGMGNMVAIHFKDVDHFFYPTSLTSSYAEPIPNLGYYIDSPLQFQPKLNAGTAEWTALVHDRRWYKLTVPKEYDLTGALIPVSLRQKIKDGIERATITIDTMSREARYEGNDIIWKFLYSILSILALIMLVALSPILRTWKTLVSLLCYFVGGSFLVALLALSMKRWKLGIGFGLMFLLTFIPAQVMRIFFWW